MTVINAERNAGDSDLIRELERLTAEAEKLCGDIARAGERLLERRSLGVDRRRTARGDRRKVQDDGEPS